MAEYGPNWIGDKNAMRTFKNLDVTVLMANTFTGSTNFSVLLLLLNKSWQYKTSSSSVSHFFLLLILTQCCPALTSINSWNSNHLSEKTEVHFPFSPLKLPGFAYTSAISKFEFPSATGVKSSPHSNVQNLSETRRQRPSRKKAHTGFVALPIHESTEFAPTSSLSLSIDMSAPVTCDIAHSSQTSMSYKTVIEPHLFQAKHSHQYYMQVSSPNDDFVGSSENSQILPSFTYTGGPQNLPLHTKYCFHGFTDVLEGSRCATFEKSLATSVCPLVLLHFEKGGGTRIIRKHIPHVGEGLEDCEYLHYCLSAYDAKLVKRRTKQRNSHSTSKVTVFKYSEGFLGSCNVLARKPQKCLHKHTYSNNSVADYVNIDNVKCCSDEFLFGYGVVTEKKYEGTDSKVNDKNLIASSGTRSKHIVEFKTSYVRSNPRLITNIKSKYSVYCRLCETASHQKINVMKQTYAIVPTFTNLDFPEPQTRKKLNSIGCRFLKEGDQHKVGREEAIDKSYFCEHSVSSITPTLPPDIFPVPSTKYSVLSTEVPYIFSYEVSIDHSVYYKNTWTKPKISRSIYPSVFPEPNTSVFMYRLDRSSLEDCRLQKSLHLESSIRSFAEVPVRSTEMPSVMTAAFSHNL